jgi:hypothetical protein
VDNIDNAAPAVGLPAPMGGPPQPPAHIDLPPAPVTPANTAAQAPTTVVVSDPNTGELWNLPAAKLEEALQMGYHQADAAAVDSYDKEHKHGTLGQQAVTAVEGVAHGLAGPLATAAESGLSAMGVPGLSPEEQVARAEVNPWTHGIGEAVGLVGPALATGGASVAARAGVAGAGKAAAALGAAEAFSQAGVMAKVGAAGAKALGLAEPVGTVAKIGSSTVKMALENMVYQGGDETSKLIQGNPDASAGMHIIESGFVGAAFGGTFGAVPPLWNAVGGQKVNNLLHAISERLGGRDGLLLEPGIKEAIAKYESMSGAKLSPEARVALSDDPALQAHLTTLTHRQGNASSAEAKAALAKDYAAFDDFVARQLGHDSVPTVLEHSASEAGKQAQYELKTVIENDFAPARAHYEQADAMAHEEVLPSRAAKAGDYGARIDSISQQINELSAKTSTAQIEGRVEEAVANTAKAEDLASQRLKLKQSAASNGTSDAFEEALSARAVEENWVAGGSNDKFSHEIMTQVRNAKNIGNLQDVRETLWGIAQRNGASSDAVRAVRETLDSQTDKLLAYHLGQKEGAEAAGHFAEARRLFRSAAQPAQDLADVLGINVRKISALPKLIEQMPPETLLSRLQAKAKGRLDVLSTLDSKYPEASKIIKKYVTEDILFKAASQKSGSFAGNVIKQLNKIAVEHPEFRNWIVSGKGLEAIKAVETILAKGGKNIKNFSNTAPVSDLLGAGVPGAAVALGGMLTGHHPVASTLTGLFVKPLAKDAPDAIKHALIRFLGSDTPPNATAFKAAVDYLNSVAKGEAALTKAVKNVFKAGVAVVPASMMPSEADRNRLSKQLTAMREDPTKLMQPNFGAPDSDKPDTFGGFLGHYLPDHVASMGMLSANAINIANSMLPQNAQQAPMDTKQPLSAAQKGDYNKLLNAIQQPLAVLPQVQNGNILPQEVAIFKSLYPQLHIKMSEQMMSEIVRLKQRGETLAYNTRMGLSVFMGQAMDSTLTPAGILGAQPAPKPPAPPKAGGGIKGESWGAPARPVSDRLK